MPYLRLLLFFSLCLSRLSSGESDQIPVRRDCNKPPAKVIGYHHFTPAHFCSPSPAPPCRAVTVLTVMDLDLTMMGQYNEARRHCGKEIIQQFNPTQRKNPAHRDTIQYKSHGTFATSIPSIPTASVPSLFSCILLNGPTNVHNRHTPFLHLLIVLIRFPSAVQSSKVSRPLSD